MKSPIPNIINYTQNLKISVSEKLILNCQSTFLLLIVSLLNINIAIGQCDPSEIDPCEIGTNSIVQASYHAQIIKTSSGYSVTGQKLAPNGFGDQGVLSNIPSDDYPMPTDVLPVYGALGGRTQAVFLGNDGNIYAVGTQDLMIDRSNTSGTAWSVTSLSLPPGITVCDVNKWEGTAGSRNFAGNATGRPDGFLVFSTFSGDLYITGDGATDIQAGASNTDWTQVILPAGITVADFAVGYRTLLVLGNDGNLYASGRTTYFGDGTNANSTAITILTTQPNISFDGITQIEAGYNSYLVLDGDGTIHVLGENSEGGLGTSNTNDVNTWSKVGANCPSGILMNVAVISTLSTHDYRTASSAILVDGTIRSWGTNDNQSITSGNDRIITCPITPTGSNAGAIAISNGGHITPYVNIDIEICNIGHNDDGAFGDGNANGDDYGDYTCFAIPGDHDICGTKEADLELKKSVDNINPCIGDNVIFTVVVKNNGPDISTGSTVRDRLLSGYTFISDDTGGAYNNLTGIWTLGPIPVEDSLVMNITATVNPTGNYFNYAQIFSDSEVDEDSTPGDDSVGEDDDATVLVSPLTPSATCIALSPIQLNDCSTLISSIYDSGNSEAELEDVFMDIINCNSTDIRHNDSEAGDICASSGLTITRTYWLTEDGVDIISCSREFILVQDTQGPAIDCPDDDATLTCGQSLPIAETILSGTDNCDDATVFNVTNVADENLPLDYCISTNRNVLRTYTVSDDCGNTSTCIQTFSFLPDTQGPAIDCPDDDATLICGQSLPIEETMLSGTDNCDNVTTFSVVDILDESLILDCCVSTDDTIERTYTVSDDCGNTSTCIQTFSLSDIDIQSQDTLICADAFILHNGTMYMVGDTYIDTLNTIDCSMVVMYRIVAYDIPYTESLLPIDTSLCWLDSLIIDLSYLDGDFLWSDASTTSRKVINKSDTYSVTMTDIFGCSHSDSITVAIEENEVTLDTLVCDYYISGLDTIMSSVTFIDTLAGINGNCPQRLIVNVDVEYTPIPDTTKVMLEFGETYLWHDSLLTLPGLYVHLIDDFNICPRYEFLLLEVGVEIPLQIYTPNVLFINDDSQSFYFGIPNTRDDVMINLFHVYDRWGNLIYQSDSPISMLDFVWHPKDCCDDIVQGVYVFLCNYTVDGTSNTKVGDITMLD